jgi:solute carrier family 25 (mitochondrial uncoupling protein), member 8/9
MPPDALSLLQQVALSGASVSVANTFTIPLDVLKVRLQLQPRGADGRQLGLVATAARVARTEGAAAFFSGLGPALGRGVAYGGTRLGCYGPAKDFLTQHAGLAPAAAGLAAGAVSGVTAAALTNPLDLVKTRVQAPRAPGVPKPTAAAALRAVLQQNGVRGLWSGTAPAAARAAVQTAAQCGAYDGAKRVLLRTARVEDGPAAHFAASAVTGLVVTTATAPFDVVKVRMYAAADAAAKSGATRRLSPLAAAADLVRSEGPLALWKGWTAQYARLGPQSVITFVVLEQLRRWAGLDAL